MKTCRPAVLIGMLAFLGPILAGCGGAEAESKQPDAGSLAGASVAGPGMPAASAVNGPAGSGASPVGSDSDVAPDGIRDEVLRQVNAVRAVGATCGAVARPPAMALRWNDQAEAAAVGHSRYMQQSNTFSHTGLAGSTVAARLTDTGYVWSKVGENIAAGQLSVTQVVQAWMGSAGHCENIMNGAYLDIGVAIVDGAAANDYDSYWTMVLARSR